MTDALAQPSAERPGEDVYKRDDRLTASYLLLAVAAITLGMLLGVLQALEHGGVDLYPMFRPLIRSYYHGLTMHGVLNALVWTTFFICGFKIYITTRAFGRPLAQRALAAATFWLMIVGLLLTAWPMLLDDATVMFTFYPPLQASPRFYIGLTLVVVGTWLVTLSLVLTYRAWRAEHPDQRTPLAAFMALVTFAMWTIASLGIAVEMLVLIIPWSLGLVEATNPLPARTLFWFTGHPIVYFWLLPAYISWYTLVPRHAGGKLFSEPMARVSFILFLILSIPVGLHHQFTDLGVAEGWKLVHAFLTFGVFFPSLLTFFNVVASLESGGRARGGTGWLGWIRHLPWTNPSLVAQLLAMILFAFGGIGGLANASNQVNLAVRNTSWIVGHFHLTVGAAVTLTFMGISYWLVPRLTGRLLWNPWLALFQAWFWFVGMIIFSNALHRLGLMDMPRRTAIGAAAYQLPAWEPILPLVAKGGLILFMSGMLYVLIVAATALAGRREEHAELRFAEYATDAAQVPAILDRWRPWLAVTALLILVAYGPTLLNLLMTTGMNVPGRRVW